jgi:hypothetical protein
MIKRVWSERAQREFDCVEFNIVLDGSGVSLFPSAIVEKIQAGVGFSIESWKADREEGNPNELAITIYAFCSPLFTENEAQHSIAAALRKRTEYDFIITYLSENGVVHSLRRIVKEDL